jgi:MFS family permease
MGEVLRGAIKDKSFILIFVGFFSCGYQLAFITAHFPAMITEICGPIDPNSVAAAFIMLPITPLSVIVFSLVMGALWLATVPLTSGLVGHIYGMRYMGTLYGLVFFSHQLGGFLGVYLGGALYDAYGTYTIVWWVGVGVGAVSALVHLPIKEAPLEARTAAA